MSGFELLQQFRAVTLCFSCTRCPSFAIDQSSATYRRLNSPSAIDLAVGHRGQSVTSLPPLIAFTLALKDPLAQGIGE